MKTYEVKAYALNKIWYEETYSVKANSVEDAKQKVINYSEDAELINDQQSEVDDTRYEFNIDSVKENEDDT
jgi:hypothetical protein